MRIDVIVQKDLPDPRGCRGVRHRLCCIAILPTGIKLNSIEISIDQEKRKVVLTADLIEALRFSDSSMCQIVNYDTNSLNSTYQAWLNDHWNSKYTMTGDIPPDEEYENQFVHPGNNLAVTDPVMIGRCDPLEGIDLESQPALVVHFFVLSVAKDPNGSSNIRRRNRFVFVSPNRQAPPPDSPTNQARANPANAVPEQVPSAHDMAEAHARTRARARARAQAEQEALREAERQAATEPEVAQAFAVNGHRVFPEYFNGHPRHFVDQQQQQQNRQENLVMAERVPSFDDMSSEDLLN